MTPEELSHQIAAEIQLLGLSFYFDPVTKARAKTHGLNSVEFYGLGRGGVLGNADTQAVFEAFTFFDASAIEFLWTQAKTKADPIEVASDYVLAAYDFADRTFGAVDPEALRVFGGFVRRVVDALEPGRCALVDGYKRFEVPTDPVHSAYLGTILLRELRGGLHIEAVNEIGLSAKEAAFLQDEGVYKFHGYDEHSAPQATSELVAKKERAEELTTQKEAACMAVLSSDECERVREVSALMFAALANPVAVTR